MLIIDDTADNREMYAEYLRYAGLRADTAADAESGLEQAWADPPGVIVMDLSLPRMDGCTATRCLRTHGRTRDVPVLVVTGHALPEHERAALEAGAHAVFKKPLAPSELLAKILELLPEAASEEREQAGVSRRRR